MRRAFDRNGNGWLATRIQRLSDSEWLQGWATGTLGFDTGQCEAFRAQGQFHRGGKPQGRRYASGIEHRAQRLCR